MSSVLIWPDGDYWLTDEGEPPAYKSDDYLEISLEDEDIEDIDDWVYAKTLEVNLGSSTDSKTLFK